LAVDHIKKRTHPPQKKLFTRDKTHTKNTRNIRALEEG